MPRPCCLLGDCSPKPPSPPPPSPSPPPPRFVCADKPVQCLGSICWQETFDVTNTHSAAHWQLWPRGCLSSTEPTELSPTAGRRLRSNPLGLTLPHLRGKALLPTLLTAQLPPVLEAVQMPQCDRRHDGACAHPSMHAMSPSSSPVCPLCPVCRPKPPSPKPPRCAGPPSFCLLLAPWLAQPRRGAGPGAGILRCLPAEPGTGKLAVWHPLFNVNRVASPPVPCAALGRRLPRGRLQNRH